MSETEKKRVADFFFGQSSNFCSVIVCVSPRLEVIDILWPS